MQPGRNIAFILDYHVLFAESFMHLLKAMHLFSLVLHSNREEDMSKSLTEEPITHIFLDNNIPGINAKEILDKINNQYPHIHVIIVSTTQNIFITERLLKFGAKAFISKSTGSVEVATCLQTIAIGRKYLSNDIKLLMNEQANILHPIHFTDKEIQVLRFTADGFTISKTAELLKISKHTVIAHRRNMMEKTGINSAAGLVKFGMDAGLICAGK